MTDAFKFDADATEVHRALRAAPVLGYRHMRDFTFRAAAQHRTTWLRQTPIRLRGVKVHRVNADVTRPNARNEVLYNVTPRERQRNDRGAMNLIRLDIWTPSEVLSAHQFGITIRPKQTRFLAVPIAVPGGGGKGRRSPRRYRERMAGNRVLLVRRSKRSNQLLLFERIRKRGGTRVRQRLTKKGKVAKRQTKTKVDILVPRWVLVPEIKVDKRLGFYETWDALAPAREALFAKAATNLVRDFDRGVAA